MKDTGRADFIEGGYQIERCGKIEAASRPGVLEAPGADTRRFVLMQWDDSVPEGAVRIPLCAKDGSVRAYALVDAADAEFINQWRWCLHPDGYARRTKYLGYQSRPMYKTYSMHRELVQIPVDERVEVDHINRVRLDNRRSNLRVLPLGKNAQNRRATGGSSVHRGVYWSKEAQKWKAVINVNKSPKGLGFFDDELEAAEAARQARKRYFPYSVD
jgi:hypothetical protein